MTDQLSRLTAAIAGRYAIEGEVGAGGMATVYLARDVKHERNVAVKVLRPDLAVALGSERFVREIAVAAQLHHPHILPLFDSGEADGFLYYVMPYEEGQSLREKLAAEGELPRVRSSLVSDWRLARPRTWPPNRRPEIQMSITERTSMPSGPWRTSC